jgi:TolB-like protein/Tfp pilus assembly protein PilF
MTQLARGSRDLHVLARNTTFQYKDKPVDVRMLGRELGARYILEGSVQRASPDPEGLSRNADVRVTARLIDAQNGTDIWSEAFDRNMADIFLVQDEIVGEIVAKIAGGYGAIERSERESARRKSTKEIQAYDLVLRARQAMQWGWTADAFTSANEFLLQAIALDPVNAQARREQAYINVFGRIFEYLESPMPLHESTAQALKAVQLDPANARAHMVAAIAYFFGKQLDLFEHEAQQAMALAPHDAEILAHLGALIGYTGQWQRGVELVVKANKLNDEAAVGWYHSTVYLDSYIRGDYENALKVLKQSPDYQPDFEQSSFYAYLDSVPILGQLGRGKEARENWNKLRKKRPGWSINDFEDWFRTWNFRDEDIAELRRGVYKSGALGSEAKANW